MTFRSLAVLLLLAAPVAASAAWEVNPMPSEAGFTDIMAWTTRAEAPELQLSVICDGQFGDFYLNFFTGDATATPKEIAAIGDGSGVLLLSVDAGAPLSLPAFAEPSRDTGDLLLSAYLTRPDILALAGAQADISVALESAVPERYETSFDVQGVQDALREVLTACK